jgi:hypothetical protein
MSKVRIAAPEEDLSRAFIAAMLAAASEQNCNCKTCQILRKVADQYLKTVGV